MITNVEILGLERVKATSGFPMATDTPQPNLARLLSLARASSGSGHDCALKGIIVYHDITASQNFWQQWQRYHFHDIVSSQSKMHKIMNFDIKKQCNKYVKDEAIQVLQQCIDEYQQNPNLDNFQTVQYNIPMGFQLTASVISNYLQLKTIYNQRKSHKLNEWKEYTQWILTLPMMKEILL